MLRLIFMAVLKSIDFYDELQFNVATVATVAMKATIKYTVNKKNGRFLNMSLVLELTLHLML